MLRCENHASDDENRNFVVKSTRSVILFRYYDHRDTVRDSRIALAPLLRDILFRESQTVQHVCSFENILTCLLSRPTADNKHQSNDAPCKCLDSRLNRLSVGIFIETGRFLYFFFPRHVYRSKTEQCIHL